MDRTVGEKIFSVFNYIVLTILALICVLPFVHIFALSLSSNLMASSGSVLFWPKEFTLEAYKFLASKKEFFNSLMISFQRVALGASFSVILTIFCAYPLSKEDTDFKSRKYYMWFLIIAMLFNGGLIPTYIIVNDTGLIDSILALIIPGAVSVYNVILMMNFFRGIPKALEEAALLDGAGHFQILLKVYLPLSLPSLATIALFSIVGHWNDWLAPIMYMNNTSNYPLSAYLQVMIQAASMTTDVTDPKLMEQLAQLGNKTLQSAQIFLGAVPILCVYPFLQKYFVKGLTLGSVK